MDGAKRWVRCVALITGLAGFGTDNLASQPVGSGRWAVSTQPPEIMVAVGYAADAFAPVLGGRSRNPTFPDNLDLMLHLNLKALPGLRGTSIRVHFQASRGESVSSGVGALQEISNLEAPKEWRLYEAWMEHQVRSPRISILAGVYDINSEFDVVASAGDFLNSSFGFGPEYGLSGLAGPSTYPSTGLAARIMVQPLPSFYGLFGLSDAVPGDSDDGPDLPDAHEGALLSFEVGHAQLLPAPDPVVNRGRRPETRGGRVSGPQRRRIGRGRTIEEVNTKVAFGGWLYSGEFPKWSLPESAGRSWGVYLLGEHRLRQAEDGTGWLSVFARVGTAADAVNRLDLSLKGGLAYGGAIPGRPDDVTGLGISYVRNGSPFLQERRRSGRSLKQGEMVIELTHRTAVGGVLDLQPDVQWVWDPGMDPDVTNSLVVGLRGHLQLEIQGR